MTKRVLQSRPPNGRTELSSVFGLVVYVIITIAVSCAGLVINAALLYSAYRVFSDFLPIQVDLAKLGQLLLYCGPVLLLYPEWTLWDAFIDRLRSRAR